MNLEDIDEFREYVFENRIHRTYVNNSDCPFNVLSDGEFKKRYRFLKHCVNDVIMPLVISADNEMGHNRGRPIPLRTKLLTALRFYATGSMQASTIIHFHSVILCKKLSKDVFKGRVR